MINKHDIWYLDSVLEVINSSRIDKPPPGSISNISTNDTAVKKAALTGTYSFNNQSNDVYLFKALEIDDAKRQVGHDNKQP